MNTPQGPSVLDQWEAEAKKSIKDNLGQDSDSERILELIRRVGKLEKALKHVTETCEMQKPTEQHVLTALSEDEE